MPQEARSASYEGFETPENNENRSKSEYSDTLLDSWSAMSTDFYHDHPNQSYHMRRVAVLASMFLLAAFSALDAQETPTTVYLNGGTSVPAGAILDDWKAGFNVGGGLEFPWTRRLRIRADVDYNHFGPDGEDLFALPVEIEGYDRSTLSLMALMRFTPFPSDRTIQPYLLAGGGYWRDTLEPLVAGDASGTTRQLGGGTDEGLVTALGAGFSLSLGESNRVVPFVEGRYMIGATPPSLSEWAEMDRTYFPVKIGISIVP